MKDRLHLHTRDNATSETPGRLVHPLAEPTLFYDPPYERPLEDEFAWHLVKYLSPVSGLRYQVPVPTPCANVWVDFVVEYGDDEHATRRIGFECGDVDEDTLQGEALDPSLAYRDALVIGAGALDVLYRFRGPDLLHRLHDCLHLVAKWEGTLFSKRGQINLHTLASPEARAHAPRPSDQTARLVFPSTLLADEGEAFAWPETDKPEDLVVHRLSRAHPAAWVRTYDEALAHFGVTPDDLSDGWAKSA